MIEKFECCPICYECRSVIWCYDLQFCRGCGYSVTGYKWAPLVEK